jgi:PAS domain S-box-containing protein
MIPLMGAIGKGMLACLAVIAAPALAQFSPPVQITVVTDDNYPPYLFQDGEGRLQGILKDKWELWSRRTGIPVKLEGMAWAAAQRRILGGGADVIEAMSLTEERAKLYEYSPAWATLEARIFFHSSIAGINDVASMRGFAIGTKDGSACTNWLRQRGIEVIRPFPDSDALVRAAGAGEIRLFCLDTQVAQYFLVKQGLAADFRQTAPLYAADAYWAVRKGRVELRDFIQRGFQRISAEELQEIDGRWLGNPLTLPIPARYYYYAASIAAVLLAAAALLILWNRSLSARVAARTAEVNSQKQVLELIADGAPLQASLDALLRNIEHESSDMLCSVLLLDEDGIHLRHAAAPSLPAGYCSAIDGTSIGPQVGSCGTAAYRRSQVVVEDIQADPLWVDYRELAAAHGLRACWSTPILDQQERVLGTFALYFREPMRPTERHQRLIAMATDTAAIAIVKARGEGERERLVHDLGERVKELAVLHAAARLFQGDRAIDRGLLDELVLLLPPGWQYPEICVARIAYGGMESQTPRWQATQWRQAARFGTGDGQAGLIEVAYLEERPAEAEGPFLAEERKLVDSLAELFGAHFERIRIQTALRESEARLMLSVRASNIGLWEWNIAEHEVYFSAEWKGMLGFHGDEIPFRFGEWEGRLHPEDKARVRAKLQACLRTPGLDYENEFRMRHKDGSYRWIYARGDLERAADGKPLRMRGCHLDITDRKRAEDETRLHAQRLRALSQRLRQVEETERRNINRELHDRIAQNLSALQLNLGTLRMELTDSARQAVGARIDDAQALLEATSNQVRDVMAELRPAALDDFGLLAALRDHAATVSARAGIAVAVAGRDAQPRLPPATEIALFRIVQEALNNVAKHARANKVDVRLEAGDQFVRLSVADDGAGFDPARPPQRAAHYGIATMRERAQALGADLRIVAAPGKGTRVEVELALAPVAATA